MTEKIKTEQLLSTKVIDANDLVFSVISKPSIEGIENIEESEKAAFLQVLDITQKVEGLLANYSYIPFTPESYRNFETLLWKFLKELNEVSKATPNTKTMDKLKRSFRGRIHKYLTQSLIASRGLTKPFGYPGDFIMMQYLYDYIPVSPTNIGKYFDQFFLNDPLAQAVMNRVKTMSKKVSEFIATSHKEKLDILNIASGPGFDLLQVAETQHDKKVTIHCFDQEMESLFYVKARVSKVNVNTSFRFYKANIRTFFKEWNQCTKFDYIYNIGLADYLPDRVLQKLMQESINNLNSQGKFVIAHKDYSKFREYSSDWLADWRFIKRSFDDNIVFIQNHLQEPGNLSHFYESEKMIIYFNEFTK